MTTKNGDMPAYPLTEEQIDHSERGNGYEGLTKRETFVMAAMQGLLSNQGIIDTLGVDNEISVAAVKHADELLFELSKTDGVA